MKFSVLLSVYIKENSEYLDQALLSIWDTQSLKPDQIVLVKDGSLTLDLNNLINRWKTKLDDVLTIVELPENLGLGAALNAGLKACSNELVARMDTDDVADPDRFAKQVTFMEASPDVAASSAQLEEWDEAFNEKTNVRVLPCSYAEILKLAMTRSPLNHPLAIFRKAVVLSVGGYPPLRKAQDYALWSLLLKKGYKLANLPDTLLKMRTGPRLFERRGLEYFKQEVRLLRFQYKIGFIPYSLYMRNMLLKACLRLSPGFVKRLAYKYAR